MLTELKPCPFCGATDSFTECYSFGSFYRACNSCFARGPLAEGTDCDTEAADPAAIESWNRRAAAPPAPSVSVPDGWRLVPAEPTSEMSKAGFRHVYHPTNENDVDAAWAAMLAAAQSPPAATSAAHSILGDWDIQDWGDLVRLVPPKCGPDGVAVYYPTGHGYSHQLAVRFLRELKASPPAAQQSDEVRNLLMWANYILGCWPNANDHSRAEFQKAVTAVEKSTVRDDLHPVTADLVRRFSAALADKLAAAERKYGYTDGWADPEWVRSGECLRELHRHIAKGDPRDVAIYCAFLLHHGASTAPAAPDAQAAPVAFAIRLADGEIGRMGWMGMDRFARIRDMIVLRPGCSYVYAYAHPPAPAKVEVTDALIEVAQVAFEHERDLRDGRTRDCIRAALTAALNGNGETQA